MDLLRSWLGALVGWIVMDVVAAVTVFAWSTDAQLLAFGTRIFWVVVPQLLVGGVAAAVATYLHRRPQRFDPRRNAVAGLGACAVLAVIQAILNLVGGVWTSAALAFVAELVGALLGWMFVSRVARRGEREPASDGNGYY